MMSRDILSPPLIRMEPNRNYRVNLIHEDFADQRIIANQTKGPPQYQETDLYGEDYNETENEADDHCVTIEELPNLSGFKLTMHVAPSFFGGLIGQKAVTKKRIENETNCELSIPPRWNNTDAFVVVKGKTRSSVIAAKHKIKLVLASLRNRMQATHFYGVALNQGQILEKFKIFKQEVLSAELPGIDESLFQFDSCLHLTFGVCVLMDDMERKLASSLLQSCRELVNDLSTPFKVQVKGLNIMNDDPSAIRVLYATVNSPLLQIFANRCYERFNSSGLGIDTTRQQVKLHMTVMNKRYEERSLTTSGGGGDIIKNFDAREILKRWSNYDFGSLEINECVLCVISGSNQDKKNEFYKISSSLKFS